MSEETVELEPGTDGTELPSGTEVGGYVIEGKIGHGGMGVVYGAHQPRIGKRVAIKVLAPQYSANPSTVRRFEQEARVVNEIRHPNIVDVFQFGELPDGRSYFVMEWLDGEPLSARIDRGKLPPREMIAICDVICDALEAAHEKGVVHRDLKSDNVYLVKQRGGRTVKLLDFGLAKLAGKQDMASINRTRSGVIVGTPAYMAPEQARGKPVDARTDIYALGVLAYKMLTGALPFKAENAMDLIVMHLNAPPPPPHKLAPDTPPELSRLVVRMMAKQPEQRPSLPEIRKAFADLRAQQSGVDAASASQQAPSRRMATSVLIGMAMFLVGVIALGAIWLVKAQNEEAVPVRESSAVATLPPPATTPPVAAEPGSAATPGSGAEGSAAIVGSAGSAAEPAGSGSAALLAGSAAPAGSAAAAGSAAPVGSAAAVGSAAPPEIEFDPDPIKRTAKKKPTDPAPEEAQPESPPIPANRPGALILVLETASSVDIDGTAVSPSTKGGRFDVAPGHHEIRVKAPGRQAVSRSFDVEAGGTAVLRIMDDSAGAADTGSGSP